MKLRNIYVICRDNYTSISVLEVKNKNANRAVMEVAGWNSASDSLMNIAQIGGFMEKKAIAVIDNVPGPYMKRNSFEVSREVGDKIVRSKMEVLHALDCIISLYDDMGLSAEPSLGVDIKLPAYKDFSEYVGYLTKLEFLFSKCTFLDVEGERFEFQNVDVGSSWITFLVVGEAIAGGSIRLIKNLLEVIERAQTLRSKHLECEKQKAALEREKQNNERKQVILDYLEESYKKAVDMVIGELETVTGCEIKNEDGDERGRIKLCLEHTGELLEQGLQFYSTIDSPQEAKALFQPMEMKYLEMEKRLELLEKKNED
ncbi:MAG: hypothetical protein LUC83_02835 [Clostridiales bacterium]|nr:hypothetical protein [Clostridiales bacterium]